jgi:RHS repeat-associated protein
MPGQNYADQRYYTATAGRFYTPDPSTGVDLKNPVTWNKYVYAGDDPVNFNDRRGLMMDLVDEGGGGGFSDYWGFGADIGGLDGGQNFTGIGDKPGGGGSGTAAAPISRLSISAEA